MIQVHAHTTIQVERRQEASLGTFTNEHKWMLKGACVGEDTELFFPPLGGSAAPARAICDTCPVLDKCRTYGVAEPWLEGILGGLTQKERRRHAVEADTPSIRRRTKGINLDAQITNDLRLMAATGVTVADAMKHVGWANHEAMRRGMRRYDLIDVWAQLRRNSHNQGSRVDGEIPLTNSLNGSKYGNRTNRENAA